MGAHMKKRILPVIIAILLILVIAGGALGKVLLDKYSYSKEEADWNEFYQVSESDRSAIILQDEMVEEQALIRDDVCYFDLATVHKYMNEVFYADMTEKLLLYANPTEVIRTTFGETSYTTTEGTQDAGYVISFVEGDTVYVAADYVKLFTNYSYDCYDRHVQVYTEWGTRQVAQLKKDTAVRLRGGEEPDPHAGSEGRYPGDSGADGDLEQGEDSGFRDRICGEQASGRYYGRDRDSGDGLSGAGIYCPDF